MTLLDTLYNEKKDAGTELITMCKAQTDPAPRTIGSYRGFDLVLSYNVLGKSFELALKGELSHTIELGSDIHGNIQRIENMLDSLPTRLVACERNLGELQTQMENAKTEVDKPFAQEDELKSKTARLAELDAMLNMDRRENDTLDMEPEQTEPVRERNEPETER